MWKVNEATENCVEKVKFLRFAEATGDHSTVSNVQYMSAQNGVWVVAATRSGIETNPITGGKLYYNGGSSIGRRTGIN